MIIVSGSSYSKSVQGKSSCKVSALVTPWGGGESKTILFSKSSTVLDHFCFELLYSQRKSMKSTLIYFLYWNKSFQFPPCMFIVLTTIQIMLICFKAIDLKSQLHYISVLKKKKRSKRILKAQEFLSAAIKGEK